MGVAKVHVCCGVTVRASVGMLGLRMCGGEWGGAGVRGLVLVNYACTIHVSVESCAWRRGWG